MGDDLKDFADLDYLADEHRTHGAIVHLVISRLDPWYGQELWDVQIGWMGTPDQEPVFLQCVPTANRDGLTHKLVEVAK